MKRKLLVMLVLIIACTLVLGCAGKSPAGVPPQGPATLPASGIASATITPSPSENAASSGYNYNESILDTSLVNITGEPDESLPEDDIPVLDVGNDF